MLFASTIDLYLAAFLQLAVTTDYTPDQIAFVATFPEISQPVAADNTASDESSGDDKLAIAMEDDGGDLQPANAEVVTEPNVGDPQNTVEQNDNGGDLKSGGNLLNGGRDPPKSVSIVAADLTLSDDDMQATANGGELSPKAKAGDQPGAKVGVGGGSDEDEDEEEDEEEEPEQEEIEDEEEGDKEEKMDDK